ncbi:RNA polymerase sigma factor [Streptomyces sp. DH10]|uniref:RNA polymerase sigma factor n=1 Tax=Streptomyces sp. DH10 TaxID=3040121 RepID=UPI002441FB0C|nr:sigma-70 family RNA polymerase sigma factor [Streptomyces sp. DH10]MDG9709670.1 sigma-70 family RNA polymerase sigma factor [Streptomyces sp. DH10]
MSGQQPDPWADQAVRDDLAAVLPTTFVAFYSRQHRAYLRYAHVQLDSREGAEKVVEDVFVQLARAWTHVLQQPNVDAYAWAALKEEVVRRLEIQGRTLALVETAAFAAVRHASRSRFTVLESKLGLYAAIARLPERQYDVILLCFVLGHPMRRVAELMGISYGTVRSHLRGARRRLSRELGIDWAAEDMEEEEG